MAWLAGAIVLQAPQASRDLRRDVQRSAILRGLNDVLPPSGVILHALARFDPFPSVDGPQAQVPAPTAKIARDPDVRRAADGVVKVLGSACGLGIEGSGWIARPGVVVTNAHVVAGEDDTVVQLRGAGPELRAHAIAFETKNDIAVLQVDGLGGRVLPIAADAPPGRSAAVLGFPQNGRYDVRAARLGATRQVISQDAYGRGPVTRSMLSLRGLVRQGNSGGPLVDGRGRVVGTVFAAASGGRRRGRLCGAQRRRAADPGVGRTVTVDTGPCAGLSYGSPRGKTLVIAEKPSVGTRSGARAPGPVREEVACRARRPSARSRGPSTSSRGRSATSSSSPSPDEYDDKFKKWRMADLPIVPAKFKLVVRDERSQKQMSGRQAAAEARRRRPGSSTPATPAARAS